MKPSQFPIVLLLTLASFSLSFAEETAGENLLKNSSLEAVDGIGLPDGWKTEGAAEFERTAGSIEISGGPGTFSQPLDLTNFAKRQLHFSLEAKGNGGKLTVYLAGTYRNSDQTFKQEILSEIVPGPEWKTFSLIFKLDVGGEIETGRIVLEKQGEGTVATRNPRLILEGLTAAQTLDVVHEERELNYALHQLEDSPLDAGAKEEFGKPLKAAIAACAPKDRTAFARLPEWRKAREAVQEAVLKASAEGRECVVSPAWPFRPLEPGINPIQAARSWNVPPPVALSGALVPFSFVLTNPANAAREWECRIFVDGKPLDAVLRRQVFMDSWYTKGRTRQADPLVRVPSVEPGVFRLNAAPLESAQFYLDLPPLPAGTPQVKVVISGQGKTVATLNQPVEILPGRWNPESAAKFDYLACLAAGVSVFGSAPDEAMQSLEEMGATAFEWTPIPKMNLAPDGSIEGFDFSGVDPWLDRLAKTSLRPALYWHPRVDWKRPGGAPIERNSPEWLRIYMEVTEAFLKRAESKGVPRSRIILWLADEPHSTDPDFSKRPDERIQKVVKLLETFRAKFPGTPILTTVTDYAQIEDVKAFAPLSDILVPLWRYSDKVLKYSPPDRNSRTEFFTHILPFFEDLQKNSGKEIWSYFIMSGKASEAIPYYLAYPVLAAQMGLTGVGHWAFSMPNASTWDDTDGKLPDYQMVYNGKENHPLNRQWNTTGEGVVPSIRWFAQREGLRDARMFRTLAERLAARPVDDPLRARFDQWRKEIKRLGGRDGYGLELVPKRQEEGLFASPDTSAQEDWEKARQALQRIYSGWLEEKTKATDKGSPVANGAPR